MLYNFRQYSINESVGVQKAQDILEDLPKEEFIQKMFGKTEFGWGDDYVLDSDSERTSSGTDKIVWIEMLNAPKEALDALNKNYEEFVKPFAEWAKSKGLYEPEILSTDDSITFQVTL